MSRYSQDIHTLEHKFSFRLQYQAGKQLKHASGEVMGRSADDVILVLLQQYPKSTGIVKRLKK